MEHYLWSRVAHDGGLRRYALEIEKEGEIFELFSSFVSHADFDLAPRANTTNCEPADPANTVTNRLNNLLKNGGDGYILQLCPSQNYLIQAPIAFASSNQEISTMGYPTTDTRAILTVNGPVSNGQGHTTAVDGSCATCSSVKLRNIQVPIISVRFVFATN